MCCSIRDQCKHPSNFNQFLQFASYAILCPLKCTSFRTTELTHARIQMKRKSTGCSILNSPQLLYMTVYVWWLSGGAIATCCAFEMYLFIVVTYFVCFVLPIDERTYIHMYVQSTSGNISRRHTHAYVRAHTLMFLLFYWFTSTQCCTAAYVFWCCSVCVAVQCQRWDLF